MKMYPELNYEPRHKTYLTLNEVPRHEDVSCQRDILCFTKRHAMKTNGEVEVQFHAFLTSALY